LDLKSKYIVAEKGRGGMYLGRTKYTVKKNIVAENVRREHTYATDRNWRREEEDPLRGTQSKSKQLTLPRVRGGVPEGHKTSHREGNYPNLSKLLSGSDDYKPAAKEAERAPGVRTAMEYTGNPLSAEETHLQLTCCLILKNGTKEWWF
jgi:hypothetical protein